MTNIQLFKVNFLLKEITYINWASTQIGLSRILRSVGCVRANKLTKCGFPGLII